MMVGRIQGDSRTARMANQPRGLFPCPAMTSRLVIGVSGHPVSAPAPGFLLSVTERPSSLPPERSSPAFNGSGQLFGAVRSSSKHCENRGPVEYLLRAVFPNATCIITLLDRLLHHADVTLVEGNSYRVRESEQETAAR